MAKILIAEDDRMLLRTVAFKLEKEGHEVFTASNGRQAMKIVDEVALDLVVSDIMMPYVNGLELIPYIKGFLDRKTAVIILTSIGLEDTVVKAFELGADDFMTKPFGQGELMIRVKKQLEGIGCAV